jgi:phosphatidate cytidylyltransferase
MSRNLITRIAVAVVAIPLILWISYQGGLWLFGLAALLATVAAGEFLVNEGFRVGGFAFLFGLAAVTLLLLAGCGLLPPGIRWAVGGGLPIIVLFFLVTGMIAATGTRPPADLFQRHCRLMWGVFYLGLLSPYVYLVGQRMVAPAGSVSGGDLLLFLFGVLWVGDTAAMGVGHALGKHRLAPTVSPKKTVEGFVGGIAGAVAIGAVMYFWKLSGIGFLHVMLMAVGCSLFGQLGDLVESMWKRSLDIKDSSTLIPGHGGVLDRFDSLLFAAPFMYYYLRLAVA